MSKRKKKDKKPSEEKVDWQEQYFKFDWNFYSKQEKEDPPTEIREDGTKVWKNKAGELHRENDRPAYMNPFGFLAWFKDGKLHRDIKRPAFFTIDGHEEYYQEGEEVDSYAETMTEEGRYVWQVPLSILGRIRYQNEYNKMVVENWISSIERIRKI